MKDREPLAARSTDEPAVDVGDAVRRLAAENEALVAGLRGGQIPQRIGMAAACQTLMVELPRELAAQVDADVASGALARRWEAARAAAVEAAAPGEVDPGLVAIGVLLREQSRGAMRLLIRRAKGWAADAYRMEGEASALEAQAARLRRVADPSPAGVDGDNKTANDGAARPG